MYFVHICNYDNFVVSGSSNVRDSNILTKAVKASLRNIIDHVDSSDVTQFMFQEGIITQVQFIAIEGTESFELKVSFLHVHECAFKA